MSQESFISDMQRALGRPVQTRGGQPAAGDVRAYFRTLSGNPSQALAAYEEYAGSFMIHVAAATRGRTGDVTWPGGTCDQWSEIVSRPQDRQHRRMIDCEGYAYLAQDLLTEADWSFIGYEVIYLPTQTEPEDFHIMAVLDSPGAQPRRVYIGHQRASDSWFSEAQRVWPGGFQNAQTVGTSPTAQAGMDRVVRRIESGAARELAPLSGRRSISPPSFGD